MTPVLPETQVELGHDEGVAGAYGGESLVQAGWARVVHWVPGRGVHRLG
jgi:hypothetical protein